MKSGKHILVGILFLVTMLAFAFIDSKSEHFAIILNIITFGLLLLIIFNLYAKNKLAFKPYFTSKWNILSENISESIYTDIPKETILEKLKEVINDNGLEIKEISASSNQILARSGLSWKSWGENIYIEIIENEPKSEIKFTSVAVYQMYTWGKNRDNFERFVTSFEESLIV
jgi:hypothetical protein